MSWWQDYKPRRHVEGGIKSTGAGSNWWSKRWNEALSRLMDAGRLGRGRTYARQGQVMDISVTEDGVAARVQGSRPKPYKVDIHLEPLDARTWSNVLDALAQEAAFAAQLLSGEMPENIEDAFRSAGASLFPVIRRELVTHCSCPDAVNPCKHIAAVYFLLGEAFDADPFILFRLRGRTKEQVLEGLRVRRADLSTEAVIDEVPESMPVEEPAVPLPADPRAFWSLGASLAGFRTLPRGPDAALSVLVRLGQPVFIKTDLLSILRPVYQRVTQKAEEIALGKGS